MRLWETTQGRAGYEHAIRELPLEHPPGTQAVYSDVGFILLGFAIEATSAYSRTRSSTSARRNGVSR